MAIDYASLERRTVDELLEDFAGGQPEQLKMRNFIWSIYNDIPYVPPPVAPLFGPTFALLGTSVTDQNSRLDIPPALFPAAVWLTDGYATWFRVLSGQRIDIPMNWDFGVSGNTSAQILARVGDVIAVHPNFCIVEMGSNDFPTVSYEVLRDNWLATITALRNAGITPVCIPAPPRAGGFLTTAQLRMQMRFTNFQKEYCRSNLGVVFIDYIPYWEDQNNTLSNPLPNRVRADNVHPAATGAYWMGYALAQWANQLFPPRKIICEAADIYDAASNPTGTLCINGTSNRSQMLGTGGTQTANAGLTYDPAGTGLATGWTLLRGTSTSTCTVKLDKINYNLATDGRLSGQKQRVTITADAGGGADEIYNLRFTPSLANFNTGDLYYSEANVEVIAAPVNCHSLELLLLETRPANSQVGADMLLNSTQSLLFPPETWKGAFRTYPIPKQSDSTDIQVNIRARLNTTASGGSITFDIGDFSVRKVAA